MKVAITGGTGFVGRHLAAALASKGHEVVLVARGRDTRDLAILDRGGVQWAEAGVTDADRLVDALKGVDAVVHCAGINREIGVQTYERVHVEGTRCAIDAARRVGARKLVMLSFAKARPNCGSPYHESKWAAEEMVRSSGLDYTIVKSGMIFGRGDHMLDHLSHALFTFPVFFRVGFREQPVRPVSVHDVVRILYAALEDPRLSNVTVPALGPEELRLSDAVRRVADVIGRPRRILPGPIWFHRLLAFVTELTMKIPLASRAQVRILTEGVADAVEYDRDLPEDLEPTTMFTAEAIERELPTPGRFGCHDLRWCVAQQ